MPADGGHRNEYDRDQTPPRQQHPGRLTSPQPDKPAPFRNSLHGKWE
jgi:hypothetical protein